MSAMLPAIGVPMPQNRDCSAIDRDRTSIRPPNRSFDASGIHNPNVIRAPSDRKTMVVPAKRITKGVRQFGADVGVFISCLCPFVGQASNPFYVNGMGRAYFRRRASANAPRLRMTAVAGADMATDGASPVSGSVRNSGSATKPHATPWPLAPAMA